MTTTTTKFRYKVFDFSGNDPETSVDKLEICSTEKKKDDPKAIYSKRKELYLYNLLMYYVSI